jgi:sigma-B regulation protein RsbU (phosphoserine phosphatase)
MPTARKAQGPFRERAELLDFLLEVVAATTESLDLDTILANVARVVQGVIPYDLLAILLYNERDRGLRIRYAIGHRDEVIKSLVIQLGEGLTGIAAETRTPVLAGDVRADARYLNALDAVRSELAVPMETRGKLVGVIDVQSTRLNAYSDHDQALLRLIASRVAVSIDNARLYRRVDRQNRMLRTLAVLSQEFSSILVLDELLGKIAKTIHALINFDAFSILLLDPERKVLRHRFSERYDERTSQDNIPLGRGITGNAALSREAIRVRDTLTDPRYIASHPDIRSEVAVPLVVQDRVVGVMDLESDRVAAFTEDHVRILGLLAPQVASSVENARLYEELGQREHRMEQDLKAARKLQSVLLPRKAPEIPGLEIAIKARPARQISGDVFDIFEQGDDGGVIAFGDVSGKGAAAALYGALVSGLLRSLAPQQKSPALLLKSLNETLMERRVDAQYATLLVLLWESQSRKFTFGNAGAELPLVFRRGEVIKPRVEGVPIGLLEETEYEEIVFSAEPGDVLLLFSDGVEDQLNSKDEDFGRGRVARLPMPDHDNNPRAIVNQVFAELDKFREDTPITDDQTLIAIRVS